MRRAGRAYRGQGVNLTVPCTRVWAGRNEYDSLMGVLSVIWEGWVVRQCGVSAVERS
jgi:hypothetical protein